MKLLVLLLAGLGLAMAQVPGFGGCPDFESQPDFDMNKFLGTWYEAERYVNIFEAGTRCVKTNYTKAVDGRFLVANEIMNRFTSIKRVLEGEVRLVVKGSESLINVKYPNLPIPYESQLIVLDTDYDSYAVMWSCSSLGIVNTQNAWILTREKLAPGTVLQKAYGILDKYKLSRTFFVKTDQNNCEIAEAQQTQTQQQPQQQPQLLQQQPIPQGNEASPVGVATSPIQNDATTGGSGNKKPGKKGTQVQKKGASTTSGRDEVVSDSEVVVPSIKEKEKEKDAASVVHVHKEHDHVHKEHDHVVAADKIVEITSSV